MTDDGPDLSCFDFGDDSGGQESRADKLKRHKSEVHELVAEAKAKKKAIPKADNEARKTAEAEFETALGEMEERHARELGEKDALAPPAAATDADATRPRLRIGSFNVHGFRNGKGRETFGEIVSLLDASRLDVIALQEARWNHVAELARALGNMFWVASRSTALLSRFPLRTTDEYGIGVGNKNLTAPGFHVSKIKRSGCEARHARALVTLPGDGGALEVLSIHLDHVAEPRRLAQLQQLKWHVTSTATGAAAADVTAARPAARAPAANTSHDSLCDAVWMGDFNALTRADYDEADWRELAAVRKRGDWEAPVSELTRAITGEPSRGGLGFVDARVAAPDTPGPRSTCRFATRIDYVYLGPGLSRRWRVVACEHVEAIPTASDHNLVVATLEKG